MRIACHISISCLVHCDAIAVCIAQASQKRGVTQNRVDNERIFCVIRPNLKGAGELGVAGLWCQLLNLISACHLHAFAVYFLVDERPFLCEMAFFEIYQELPVIVYSQAL